MSIVEGLHAAAENGDELGDHMDRIHNLVTEYEAVRQEGARLRVSLAIVADEIHDPVRRAEGTRCVLLSEPAQAAVLQALSPTALQSEGATQEVTP